MIKKQLQEAYFFPLLLILMVISGGIFGFHFPQRSFAIKPLGDLFLNLIFTTIVPLVFFSVAFAIAKAKVQKQLGTVMSTMMGVFITTGLIAAMMAYLLVQWIPLGVDISALSDHHPHIEELNLVSKIVSIFSVSHFLALFSHQNMLALIVFAVLTGIASAQNHDFMRILQSGEKVFMKVFSLVMYYAPIGFFCYFAAMVAELGPQIMSQYVRVATVYYVYALLYFVCIYSLYAFLGNSLCAFWKNVFVPAITALATCSSAATIPGNLEATQKMGVPKEISETVIPLGTLIHKEGSIIGGMVKIAFLFGVYHMDFNSLTVMFTAMGVSMLVGTVMGAIPSGGMLGEMLILSVYGFPSEALMMIAAISVIIDPIATLLNATGNTVSALLVRRIIN
jgi:Na+/H+-dicarboxylate symporter